MALKQLLCVLLLMALARGQPPAFPRSPDKWSNYMLPVWADYSYRVSQFIVWSNKYYWKYNVFWLDGDYGSYGTKFIFKNVLDSVKYPDYTFSWQGRPSDLGSDNKWYGSVEGYEIISAYTYVRETSPLFDSFLPSGGIQLCSKTWCGMAGYGGNLVQNLLQIPGPIMGFTLASVMWSITGVVTYQDQAFYTIHDLSWCQNENIPSFSIISGQYVYTFQMGSTVTIPVDHTYNSWDFYSNFCSLTMKTLYPITHRIHQGEQNLSMDYLNIRLWNEQAWMVVNVGTTPKYQILPQQNTCVNPMWDCLSIDKMGGVCVDVDPHTYLPSPLPTNFAPTSPDTWTPNCNQDMTVTNKTDSDPVIKYLQNTQADNRRGVIKLQTINPWMEGNHTMRLRIYNAGIAIGSSFYDLTGVITTDMTQDIQFRVTHNCLYTFIQYNTTYKTFGGKIQDMTVPVATTQYQDLLPCFSHTYAYRWPPLACNMGFEITSIGRPNIMTLVGNVLTVITTNPIDTGTWSFTIKVYIKEAPTIFWSLPMKVTIMPPCNILSYKVYKKIPETRYVIGLFDEMPLEFSFTFLNYPCDLWQFFWFTVTDLSSGLDISTTQTFISIQQDDFPNPKDALGNEISKYPRLIVLSHVIADRGTYLVQVYAKLATDPIRLSEDSISFTLTMDIDKCLLTYFDDQFFADQTFTIDMNQPSTKLIYKQFEDWVTRDAQHDCGPRKYELSSIAGGGSTGKYLPLPGSLPAVPNLINFQNNDAQTCIIQIQTTTTNPYDPYAVGVYMVQMIISLQNWPLYYNIQKLVKTFKVTINSVCLTKSEILYSTFPLLLHKVAFTSPVTTSTFTFNPIPDFMSSIYAPNDGVTFCGDRAYSGFHVTCSDCDFSIPSALIKYAGTVITLDAVTFMYLKQNPTTDTTFTVDSQSQDPDQRSYWGQYTLYFSVGFLHYPSFVKQEFNFPAQIVPDCQNAIITGPDIENMQTYISTPVSATYVLSAHDEQNFNAYNYYCDNGLLTGGITYTLQNEFGLSLVQTYLIMTVTTLGVTLAVNTQDPSQVQALPYNHSIKQCLTYYPTNCITKAFTVTLNPDCSVITYNSTDVPKLQETYQVGQSAQTYNITFATGFDDLGPINCVYFYHWQVMVDGVNRTNNMPDWLTVTLTSMTISSFSSADVGKHEIKVYSFLDKVPVFPTNLTTQIPTEVTIDIMSNPCVNTRIQQTLEGKVFSYTITYNTVPVNFTNPGYNDTVTVSGAANCGEIIYTVTDITGADYSSYMAFSVDGRKGTVTCSVSTKNPALMGIHNFKVHAMLQQFPALDPMLGIDNFFSINITSSCVTDVIYRPMSLPDNIITTIDSSQKSYVFQPVQDSISTNAGFTNLDDSGGLCGPWAFDIRVGSFYQKDYFSGGSYVLQTTSPQGLAIVATGRTLVIDGKKSKQYIGKQQIFITVVSTLYQVIKNEFEVMVWVYNYCQKTELTKFVLPKGWMPQIDAIYEGDSTKTDFPEWTLQTELDYCQDWVVSCDYICGPRQFFIKTNITDTAITPSWIISSMEKKINPVGIFVPVVVRPVYPLKVGTTVNLEYCANLTNFDSKVCSPFTVQIRDQGYVNQPPYFEYVGFEPNKEYQTYGMGKPVALGSIICKDKESNFSQLDVKVSMSTNDAIDPKIWYAEKWFDKTDGKIYKGGVLLWNTTESDDGKRATLSIVCSDGIQKTSQNLLIQVVYKNKRESAITNQTFKNNKPEVETVNLDTTLFADKIKASVQVGGRNYTLVRPTVYIKSINSQGLVTLRFSEDMVFKAGIETDQVMMKNQLRVEYLSGFYGDEIGWDKNLNNLKWVVSSVDKREMHLQLMWKAPGWISQGSGFDKLRVTFLEAGAFVNVVATSIQDETTYKILEFFLPAQIDKNSKSARTSSAFSQSLTTTGSTLVCSGAAMTVVLGTGMAEIWGMINGVQLLIFSPALRLKMPANAQIFIANIIQMATFDYIPMDTIFESQFDLQNYEAINPYLNAVGLNTSWFILNLGSQWLFLAFAVLGLVLLPILSFVSRKTGLLKSRVAILKSQLMWSYFILFMTSMSLEISLACLIQYQKLVWKFSSSDEAGRRLETETGSSPWLAEIISTYSAIIVGGVFVIFNVMTPVFLYRNFKNLAHPVVQEPWGAIYNDVRIEKWSLFYPNILMAKRIILSVILMYLTVNGFIQVLFLQHISVFSLIYLGQVTPMTDPLSQNFEVINEVMVFLLSYALMMFNDYLDPDQRELMGWYICVVIGIYLSLHITRLCIKKFKQLVKKIKDRCFKWQFNRLKAARQKLLIFQLKATNQVEPQIELPGISPRFSKLKFRRRQNLIIEDEEYDLSPRQSQTHVLSEAEKIQLAQGVQAELIHDADAGVFNTGVLYHLNQPFDQSLNLAKIHAGTSDESVILSSVDSLAVDSSSQSDISFRQTPRQSWFVIPEMPNEDIL